MVSKYGVDLLRMGYDKESGKCQFYIPTATKQALISIQGLFK